MNCNLSLSYVEPEGRLINQRLINRRLLALHCSVVCYGAWQLCHASGARNVCVRPLCHALRLCCHSWIILNLERLMWRKHVFIEWKMLTMCERSVGLTLSQTTTTLDNFLYFLSYRHTWCYCYCHCYISVVASATVVVVAAVVFVARTRTLFFCLWRTSRESSPDFRLSIW